MLASLIELQDTFSTSIGSVSTAAGYLPIIIMAIVIVVIGWILGSVVRKLIENVFKSLSIIDDTARKTGLTEIFERAGIQLNVGKFIGVLVQLFIVLIALVAAFDVVGLSEINRYLSDQILTYIPNVMVATLILVAGFVIAEFVKNFVRGATKATKLNSASVAGNVAKWAVLAFTILAALDQLRVAEDITTAIIVAIIASLSLALGLAFGLGGQRAAAEYLDKLSDDIRR